MDEARRRAWLKGRLEKEAPSQLITLNLVRSGGPPDHISGRRAEPKKRYSKLGLRHGS